MDVGEAYLSVEVRIARKYLLDERGSCNGYDQVASLTPHRAPDLSDTSVPLAFSGDALRLSPARHSTPASSTNRENTATHSILQLLNLSAELCVSQFTNAYGEDNAAMTKEAFIVPTGRSHSFNQRFRSLFQAFFPLISTIGLEDVKASDADNKPHIFMQNVRE